MRSWADQSTSRPPHNSAGAPRPNAEADTNITRGVSTAEPEDALRVRPQRTLTRQKFRPAQCQQTAHCTPLARSTTLRPQHQMHRRLSHVPHALDSLCCTAHPPALTAPDTPKVARTQTHTRHHAHWWDQAPISISRPNNDRNRACPPPSRRGVFPPSPPFTFSSSCATRPLKRTGSPAPPAMETDMPKQRTQYDQRNVHTLHSPPRHAYRRWCPTAWTTLPTPQRYPIAPFPPRF